MQGKASFEARQTLNQINNKTVQQIQSKSLISICCVVLYLLLSKIWNVSARILHIARWKDSDCLESGKLFLKHKR